MHAGLIVVGEHGKRRGFWDVPATSPFQSYIEELARRGAITADLTPQQSAIVQFGPQGPMTREEMAALVHARKQRGYAPVFEEGGWVVLRRSPINPGPRRP